MKKRILSLFLALAMVCSLLPGVPMLAFAEEEEGTFTESMPAEEPAVVSEEAQEEAQPSDEEQLPEVQAESLYAVTFVVSGEKEGDSAITLGCANPLYVSEGSTTDFTLMVNEGYELETIVRSDGGSVDLVSGNLYTISGISADTTVTVYVIPVEQEEPETGITGGAVITAGGEYQLAGNATGVITIATTEEVTLVGNGAAWDESCTMTTAANSNLYIDCTTQAGVNLTLKDVYITNSGAQTAVNGDSFGLVAITGTANVLSFEGVSVLEFQAGGGSGPAAIHVKQGDGLTIGGSGTVYFYKNAQGAGIGGSSGEFNGDITFDMTGALFAKGSKQGALIGAGSSANGEGLPGSINFVSGSYNLVSVSRGAVIGGSAGSTGASSGTSVFVGPKANININVDFSGAAVGGGGYAEGNDASGGVLTLTGGSLRTYIDSNAAGNTTGWQGNTYTEGINDAAITAQRVNGEGEAVYLMAFDTAQLSAAASLFTVYVDGSEEIFYQGGLPEYGFVQEGLDKEQQLAISSTPSNWYRNGETNLYFYLTGEDHTLTVNGETFTFYWDEVFEVFTTEKYTTVTFVTDPADAEITVSCGMGYTYTEITFDSRYYEAVEASEATEEAVPAMRKFSLLPGTYTATIRADGHYASQFSFKVTEEGKVTSVDTTSNVKNYLDMAGTFTINLPVFEASANAGAWDGVTIDVSWYSENAAEMYVTTPAQLAGMAAICNGIYNAEITAIIDDADGDGVTETYTPAEYAALENRKIRAATSSGEVSGPNGGNLVSSDTYWYGVRSDGKASDFNGQTVYIMADLDMGGYQNAEGEWTGARYMTIGGQSQMHYIDYSVWEGDGYSHLGSSFNGHFEGQGHIIYNVYCDRYVGGSNYGDSASVGLIGRMGNNDNDSADLAAMDPSVRDIAVSGYVYGRRSVGGIVGKTGQTSASMLNDGSTGAIIENCMNFAEVRNTDAKGVGGICGAAWNEGVIRNCVNFGSIYAGRQNAGGICGSCEVAVINCYNVGYVGAVSYNYGQAIGTNNGGASYTNVYWLTGSGLADSVDSYPNPAVYGYSSADTITEITSFGQLATEEFLAGLNGTGRAWTFASEDDRIYELLASVSFDNCKLDTTGVSAAGFPILRCFTGDGASVISIEKKADPSKLAYVEDQTFDPTGMEIWANYSDGTSAMVTSYTVTPAGPLTVDDTQVTVSGSLGGVEFSYTFPITVAAKEVAQIRFQSKPTNMLYASDETLDASGMVIAAYYTDAPEKAIVLNAEDYTSEFVSSSSGGYDLVVTYSYRGKTVTASEAVTILDTTAPVLNAEGFYELTCTNDLLWFANQVNKLGNGSINGLLMADIAMPADFTGIGVTGKYYSGIFEGNEHTVTLTTSISSGGCALFAAVSGAQISGVIVDGSVTSAAGTANGIAGLVGYAYFDGVTISNCINRADVSGAENVGGILGKVVTSKAPVTVEFCRNEGNITGTKSSVGGIVGGMSYYSGGEGILTVNGCTNTGAVTSGGSGVGGILGTMASSGAEKYIQVLNCGNDGSVTGAAEVGGIVGGSKNSSDRISGCYNAAPVRATAMTGTTGVGGIAGYGYAVIDSCYNCGSVSSTGSSNTYPTGGLGVGGILGGSYGAAIRDCYNVGTIEGDSAISTTGSLETLHEGGILGYANFAAVTCENSYYLEAEGLEACGGEYRSGLFPAEGHSAVTAEELKAMAADLGSSYRNSSDPEHHGGYPVLVWESCAVPFLDVNPSQYYYTSVLWAVENGITAGYGTSGTLFAPDINCTRAQVVTFLWRASGSPTPETTENPFKDVSETDWYYTAVLWAAENGITAGYGAAGDQFRPDLDCTRAQVVTFLHRVAGEGAPVTEENPFNDVDESSWYYKAVLWAVENGITAGYGNTGGFAPDVVCSRGQIVTFLYRAYN